MSNTDETQRKLPARISGQELRVLLGEPLARLKVQPPTLAVCEEFAVWIGSGPMPKFVRPTYISSKPHRYATALRGSLTEVEAHYRLVHDQMAERLQTPEMLEALRVSGERDFFEPLQRLKESIDECSNLLKESPLPFHETWDLAAVSLLNVFGWAVGRGGSNARSGLSKGGPAMSFVYAGLEKLGWRRGSSPTEDAVLQHLKRYRKAGTIACTEFVQDK